jgi:hypothetical protein
MHALATNPVHRLDPRTAADAVVFINDDLAGHRTIPPAIADAVRGLVDQLLASDIETWLAIDPFQALLVHRALLEAQEAATIADDRDARNRLRLALARLVDALYLVNESEETSEARSSKEIVQWLAANVDVPQKDLAELLGVDLRKLQRWLSDATANQPEADEARRVRTVAKIVNQLRHVLTAPGVIAWFDWPSPDLGGKTPASVLGDVAKTSALLSAASNMRSTSLS